MQDKLSNHINNNGLQSKFLIECYNNEKTVQFFDKFQLAIRPYHETHDANI